LRTYDRHLVVRVSWVFGPDRPSFINGVRRRSSAAGVKDPGYSSDCGYNGILHFANAGECSWQEYAQFTLDCCRSLGISLEAKTVGALELADMKNWMARRPVYSVLSTAKFFSLTGSTPRNWCDAVAGYLRDHVCK